MERTWRDLPAAIARSNIPDMFACFGLVLAFPVALISVFYFHRLDGPAAFDHRCNLRLAGVVNAPRLALPAVRYGDALASTGLAGVGPDFVGLAFFQPRREVATFWNLNVLHGLDVFAIDGGRVVDHIELEPNSLEPKKLAPHRLSIELPRGKYQLKKGDPVEWSCDF